MGTLGWPAVAHHVRTQISADLPLSKREKSEWLWKKIWISRISPPPPPPSPISYQCGMKNIHQEQRLALLHYIEVQIYPQFRKNNNTQLASKRPISKSWDWRLKWLKIKNQLQKWLKRTIATAEGGIPFWGVWEHARQEKFWKFMLQMRPFGAILHHFIVFFSPLKIQDYD